MLLCDHATNAIPDAFDSLGLTPAQLETHIAYDPGAAALTVAMAGKLGAAYVLCNYSRLLIDVNRKPDDPDSIVVENDGIRVPGNAEMSDADRSARIRGIYQPYHQAIDQLLDTRLETRQTQLVISVHSFTPRIGGMTRPWDIGIILNRDRRLARRLVGQLVEGCDGTRLTLGLNRPYSPDDRVYHTIERHGEERGLPCVMIEIANNQLMTDAGCGQWADRLSAALRAVLPDFSHTDSNSRTAPR
ncbi:N-formylglutamate amidohydrolase [Ferruginivarius sediminum]|uniref:N-formylglutamate amidohydrolase n=1 Tax=Ferruginivarius sediminum TaxID=2661937 RepID=UPI001379D845|nr:N-formylglutamate amidohydrolase [Ferruginivarius sediminum]